MDSSTQINQQSNTSVKYVKGSGKNPGKRWLVLLAVIIVLLARGAVYLFSDRMTEVEVPSVPESEPKAQIQPDPCTITFRLSSEDDLYPQCLSIGMLDNEGNIIDPDQISLANLNQPVNFSCQGNVNNGDVVPDHIKIMQFRVVRRLLDEQHNHIDTSTIWEKEVVVSRYFGGIAYGYSMDNPQAGDGFVNLSLGQYAAQCRVCIEREGTYDCTEWDEPSWPDLSPPGPPQLSPIEVTPIVTGAAKPPVEAQRCTPKECGDSNIRCLDTMRLECLRGSDNVCRWQCVPIGPELM